MATDYTTLFATLGAELRNHRKVEALYEHFHFVSNSNYSKRLVSAAYSDSDVYQEAALTKVSQIYDGTIAENARGNLQALKANFEQGWFPVLDSLITTNPNDKAVGAISYAYDGNLSDGTIAILSRQGRWGALRAQMLSDDKIIKGNVVAFGSMVAIGENYGTLTLSDISGADHTLGGTLTLICVDDTVGAQKFQVQNILTNKLPDPTIPASADGLFSILSADNQMTLGKSFEDGTLGINMLIDVGSPVEVDPDSLFSAVNVPYSGESDTNKGIIYLRVTRQAADPYWLIQWYSDAALTNLVTQTSVFGLTGTAAISMSGTQTLFQATFDMDNAVIAMPSTSDTADFSYNLNLPRLNDQWTIAITNSEAGNFATKIAHEYRASLPSGGAAPGSGPSVALAGVAGLITLGSHLWAVSFLTAGVESGIAASGSLTTVGGNQQVNLTAIATGPVGTTARKVYRTKAGETSPFYLLTTIADNVTTTYTDNTADGSLGTATGKVIVDDTLAASVSMS